MGVFLIFVAFVAIMLFAYLSYRKSEAREQGIQYDGNKKVIGDFGKKVLYYAVIAGVFILVSICVISLEAIIFDEPKRGYIYGAFALAVVVTGGVGKRCKKWLKI